MYGDKWWMTPYVCFFVCNIKASFEGKLINNKMHPIAAKLVIFFDDYEQW